MLMFISLEINAKTIDVDNGSYRYKGDHWNKNSTNYKSFDANYFRSYQIEQMKVRAANGATSVNTVPATIEQKVGKRPVTDAILDKARTAGKSLGKGAATLGRTAVKRHPWGLAFALALEGLAGSDFFWDDEKGDFVRLSDENDYFIVKTNASSDIMPKPISSEQLSNWCDQPNQGTLDGNKTRYCEISIVRTTNVQEEIIKKCGSFTKKIALGGGRYNEVTYQSDGTDVHGRCIKRGTPYGALFGVRAVKVKETIPITPDEFFDESEPDADKKPNEWVETSGVKPTDDPSVSVPAGTVAQTSPYTDPQDGKTKQTRWDFEPNGRVRETVIPRPDLVPDSPEAPRLDPPTEEETPPSDNDSEKDKEKDKEQQEQFDLCKEHPEILACQKMGEVENDFFDDIKIPNVVDDTTWEEDRFLPSNGTCPAPKTFHVFDKPVSLSYEPLCRFMGQVRFIILVAFILMSAYLVFGGLRKE